jgi:hypothetical protein
MILASKNTFSLRNLKILRAKVMKILPIWLKKFCEYGPCVNKLTKDIIILIMYKSKNQVEKYNHGYSLDFK